MSHLFANLSQKPATWKSETIIPLQEGDGGPRGKNSRRSVGRETNRKSTLPVGQPLIVAPTPPTLPLTDQRKNPLQVAELISGSSHAAALTSMTFCNSQYFIRDQAAARRQRGSGPPSFRPARPLSLLFVTLCKYLPVRVVSSLNTCRYVTKQRFKVQYVTLGLIYSVSTGESCDFPASGLQLNAALPPLAAPALAFIHHRALQEESHP